MRAVPGLLDLKNQTMEHLRIGYVPQYINMEKKYTNECL